MKTTLTNAQVLCALYNSSRVLGMGALHAQDGKLTEDEANKLLGGVREEPGQPRIGTYFDYLNGKIIKTDVSKRPLELRLFDRDNGEGAGERAIKEYEACKL